MKSHEPTGLALALSGGGVRAMVFHAGVLRWLAENNKLEKVTAISSVSGGSLLVGLVFHLAHWRWPASPTYLAEIYPVLRTTLTTTNLGGSALRRLMNPSNWRFVLSRANVIAKTIEDLWDIAATLVDLPASPVWSVNGTTAENGRRFRFKRDGCGDYELGYAAAAHFKVAAAMAASAAYPFLIGPLSMDARALNWFKRDGWTDEPDSEEPVPPPYPRLHIFDGGIYDNLGMEPFFDVGTQAVKDNRRESIILSDAGAPLSRGLLPGILTLNRAARIVGITMDQDRALRVRCFVNFLKNNPARGAYLQIGSDPRIVAERNKDRVNTDRLSGYEWLSSEKIGDAAKYPTDISSISEADFDLLSRHGYETARWNELLFG